MADRKKGPGRPKKPSTVPIQIKVTEAMAMALEALASQRQHSRTLEIVLMIERELTAAGMWPPKQGGK